MKRSLILVGFLVIALTAAVAPPGQTTEAQPTCFQETGFCITDQDFLEYFNLRGGVRILGYPISRTFVLDGFPVQFFQRVVLQRQAGGVSRLNILDPNVLPLTRANGSVFPAPDPALAQAAPNVGSPDYATRVIEFVQAVSPDTWNGIPVGFFTLFNTTVPVNIAFPGVAEPNPGLVTLLNLEIWGVPTSNPAADPTNPGFVYQRYQRGIMHYRMVCNCTEGILVGDYLKSVITGQNLPPDLAQDMAGSRFFYQWNPNAPNWVARPDALPNTDLTNAFSPDLPGFQAPPPAPGTVGLVPTPLPPLTPGATATPTPTGPTATPTSTAPNVVIQVDDDRIDPGQKISITVIASDDVGLDWIEWEGVDANNDNNNNNGNGNDNNTNGNGNDNTAADPALARQRFDCDDQKQCANVWTVTPTISGDYHLRGRARNVKGVRSDWVSTSLRVRAGQPPNPTNTPIPTDTPLPTNTPGSTNTPTATPTATKTP
ncbi:MAG: hypothetical protein IT305_03150 [Chloroflexi bacterium]|nr:hypothetical protein [Chloroflexota bacterium]